MSLRVSYNHFRLFIVLHKALVKRMLSLDCVLCVTGAFFLVLPLHRFAFSLENLAFLLLGAIALVLYQIHLFRTCTAGPYFYFSLPVNRTAWTAYVAAALIIPALILDVLAGALLLLMNLLRPPVPLVWEFDVERLLYCVLITVIVKILPLPIFILYKKHLSLVPGFFILLGLIYFCLSIIQELCLGWLHNPASVMAAAFTGVTYLISIRIIASARME